uniref:Uncharacterized protein n=1 Tax=Lepisosteus oculatus TaxID=7918 RepID=W5LVW3_LEPOC
YAHDKRDPKPQVNHFPFSPKKAKTREIINNLNNKLHSPAPSGVSTATSSPGRKVPSAPKVTDPPGKPPISSRAAEGERQDHTAPPGGWRTLHKTGSSGALGVAGLAGGNREPSTTLDSSHRVTRSASSPRLSSTDSDSREPRLARVPPTPARRLFSVSDSSQDAPSSGSLARSSSYTRRLHSQSGSDSSPAVPRSSSFGRRPDVSTATSVTTATSSSTLNRPNSLLAQRLVLEQADKKEPVPITTTSTTSTTTAGQGEAKERRRSYLTPVRDEEAEAQRRAKSRDARRTRRSTQVPQPDRPRARQIAHRSSALGLGTGRQGNPGTSSDK